MSPFQTNFRTSKFLYTSKLAHRDGLMFKVHVCCRILCFFDVDFMSFLSWYYIFRHCRISLLARRLEEQYSRRSFERLFTMANFKCHLFANMLKFFVLLPTSISLVIYFIWLVAMQFLLVIFFKLVELLRQRCLLILR